MPQDNYYDSRERRSSYEPDGPREGREAPRRPRKKRRSAGRTAALVLLYVAVVIGVSVMLACIGTVILTRMMKKLLQEGKEQT